VRVGGATDGRTQYIRETKRASEEGGEKGSYWCYETQTPKTKEEKASHGVQEEKTP